MALPIGELRVYSDFLTNTAVAWFSAGVIAPLFYPAEITQGAFRSLASLIAIIGCIASLRLATLFAEGE